MGLLVVVVLALVVLVTGIKILNEYQRLVVFRQKNACHDIPSESPAPACRRARPLTILYMRPRR